METYRIEFFPEDAADLSTWTTPAMSEYEALDTFRRRFPDADLERVTRTRDGRVLYGTAEKVEHRSTVTVDEIRAGDRFDDGMGTVYTVTEALPANRDGNVALRVVWGSMGEWLTFPSRSLMGLLNR